MFSVGILKFTFQLGTLLTEAAPKFHRRGPQFEGPEHVETVDHVKESPSFSSKKTSSN